MGQGAFIPQQNGAAGGGAATASAISSIAGGTTLATGPLVSFADSNGVSFGVNGNTVTASQAPVLIGVDGFFGGVPVSMASNSSLYFSDNANIWGATSGAGTLRVNLISGPLSISAGTQQNAGGPMVFSNSNGVSFGMSGSSQVTARVATVSGTAGQDVNIIASGAPIVLSNANSNILISANGAGEVYVSGAAVYMRGDRNEIGQLSNRTVGFYGIAGATRQTVTGTGATAFNNLMAALNSLGIVSNNATMSALATGNVGALAAGTQTGSSGTIVFSNANNFSFGMLNSSQITAQFPAVALAAGTQTATQNTVVLSNANNVTFGMNGSTQITASVTVAPASQSYFELGQPINLATLGTTATGQRMQIANRFVATRFAVFAYNTAAAADTFSASIGMYTMNGSTASIVSSITASLTVGAVASPAMLSATLPSWNITPGDYYVLFRFSGSAASFAFDFAPYLGNIASFSYFERGVFTNATTGSLNASQITASVANFSLLMPALRFVG